VASQYGIETRPVVLGPLSPPSPPVANFEPISLLPKLIPVYTQLLSELRVAGVEWVQIDEPILVLDKAAPYASQYETVYAELVKDAPKLLVTTYFARLDSNLDFVAKLPIAGLHVDLNREPTQLEPTIAAIKSTNLVLSLGLVSGCNIWKTDSTAIVELGRKAIAALGHDC